MLSLGCAPTRLHDVFSNVLAELYTKTFDMNKEAFKTYFEREIGLEDGEWEEIEGILPKA